MSAVSKDRGTTWSKPVRIDDGKGRGAPIAPRVVFAGGRAVVMWTAAVGGVNTFAEVWADSSADGGLTWGEDVLIQEQPGGTAPTTQLFSDGTVRRRSSRRRRAAAMKRSTMPAWKPTARGARARMRSFP